MDDVATVRCMRHCNNDFNIFYVSFPEFCPICKGILQGSFLALPPFCVPHPFISSSQAPYSIVVKPTEGCFLKTYQSGHDLHIGLTSSKGLYILNFKDKKGEIESMVYNFDQDGVHIDNNSKWPVCIAVNILHVLKGCSTLTRSLWDQTLCEHSKKSEWTYDKYDLTSNNCYDFVFSFLKNVSPEGQDFVDKDDFCKKHILPRTMKAAQYIDLHRKVTVNGFVVSKASLSL